ncbi:TPA: NAD(P)H-hydrate dehydratase [Streptococcus pneumoniae]|uniref:ADP-dependent (S)-NAD(P)H-hydrate dehydratase n=2 Tax=Streptococcus pneumoniae TaxID=1313 RepID=A0A4N2GJK7_STREE|nr:NAD(P)H-hydrate dehydratase [Streptococcus pneumoniae]KXW53935.1 carbohydrate kinase [Streptococcus pneumoniae]MBW7556980.1 NAD(P)H-hydrate dehydratase [Streptococcus pneumoniae]MBW8168621.1 NAD(P)H-hydrate dehydratase [Streptococcus pneumoniae]MDV8188798.1 NAD(P)H-hydrate dehydratase [Streptococcus pneumoniae]MDV8301660.1 NAD(P)H-hydrate dehydratase [Streptococcus pneumoniae]
MKVINQTLLEKVIIERSRSSHKGDYGRLLLLGGTYPYGGAIIMAALVAVKSGAGLVTVGTDRENIPALHSHLPEAMAFALQDKQLLKEQLEKAEVVLLGPGLGDNAFGEDLVKQVFAGLKQNQILIVDGGALTILARTSLSFPSSQLILTPHQKEWEKLSGITIEKQKEDTTASALTSFPKGTILVEKGPATRVWQAGQSDYYQLQVGGPYQATGGMGDTLAGMIAGFVGQFRQASLYERVAVATHLHSAIAQELSQENYVVLPTEISRYLPKIMKIICQQERVSKDKLV